MRAIFMGTPDFAVGTLEAMINYGHEVLCVITQPDKPKGRSGRVSVTPVKEAAQKAGILVRQPEKVRSPEFISVIEEMKPDVIVVVAFGQIIPQSILDIPVYGCVNVHASLLPSYRGAAPIQWCIINGDKESGVTTMQMDAGIDTGDILLQKKVFLSGKETGGSLFEKLSTEGALLLVKTLEELEKGRITPVKQGETDTMYAKMLNKKMGRIDFNKPAEVIERWIRGLNPWPSAYTTYRNKVLKIWDADLIYPQTDGNVKPGQILWASGNELCVCARDGALLIRELQLEGKKRMKTEEFLRGYKVQTGELLGAEG